MAELPDRVVFPNGRIEHEVECPECGGWFTVTPAELEGETELFCSCGWSGYAKTEPAP